MSRVKAGEAFVEINGDPRKLFATLNKVTRQIVQMGSSFSNVGRKMVGIGAGLAAPFGAAVVAGSRFQDVLLNVRASTGATAAQLEQVKAAAMAMSQSLGVGPTEAAAGFLELLKAGMSLEQVLSGAGKAAIQFAKVGGMAVSEAAVVMADAMNVFKVTAETAANTLSSAADASSTSIEGIALAFSQVSAVAGLANQSIQDTAAALAVLANAGVKGSDAGTSLKTMLMRLMAPADDAAAALQSVGLSTQSFRNADGTMKPMVEIIRTLNDALGDMDQAAKDDIFRRIFGQDAIRAAAVLTQAGVAGFEAMQNGMAGALSVGDKFNAMSSGLSGAMVKLLAAMERLAITVTDAIGPALMSLVSPIAQVIDGITLMVSRNQELVDGIAKSIAIFVGVGAAFVGIGSALRLASFGMGGLLKAASLVVVPLVGLITTAAGLVGSFALATASVVAYSAASVAAAVASGTAWAVANAPLFALVGVLGAVSAGIFVLLGGFDGIASSLSGSVSAGIKGATSLFSDLGTIAKATFDGLFEALAGGDLQGAMEIAMAGVVAAFSKGTSALLKNLDITWATILNTLDAMQTYAANPTMLLPDGFREPYIEQKKREMEQRQDDRLNAAEGRDGERKAKADAAMDDVTAKGKNARDKRVKYEQFADLLKSIEGATSIDQLRDLYGEFGALSDNNRLTPQQAATIEAALEDAQERITRAGGAAAGAAAAGGAASGAADPEEIGKAADGASQMQAEIAGTFSALAANQLGTSMGVQQKQLDELKGIHQELKKDAEPRAAA